MLANICFVMFTYVKATSKNVNMLVEISQSKRLQQTMLSKTGNVLDESWWVDYIACNQVYISYENDTPLGYVVWKVEPFEIVLEAIVVKDEYTGEGVGSGLLHFFQTEIVDLRSTRMVYVWVNANDVYIEQSLTRQGWFKLLNSEKVSDTVTLTKFVLK